MTVVQHTVGLNRRITISINKFIKSFCQYNACYDVTAMFAVAAHHVTSEQTVIMCLRVHVFTCLRKYPPPFLSFSYITIITGTVNDMNQIFELRCTIYLFTQNRLFTLKNTCLSQT